MKYKVVKEFDSLKKGDILENDLKDVDIFSFEEETETTYKYISYSTDIIENLVEQGYLVEVEEEEENTPIDVINKAIDEIERLIVQYKKDNEEVTEKVANNELPYCVKVEADTVHSNLTKVLEHIKDILLDNE